VPYGKSFLSDAFGAPFSKGTAYLPLSGLKTYEKVTGSE
jgi:hypothetical protein